MRYHIKMVKGESAPTFEKCEVKVRGDILLMLAEQLKMKQSNPSTILQTFLDKAFENYKYPIQ